jgi:hypothetical protein
LEVEPAEGRRRIQIRDFVITERLLSFWKKDSRALADIPNDQSNVFRITIRHWSRQRAASAAAQEKAPCL